MLWFSRRTFVATLAILVLGGLGYFKGLDVAVSIAMIATGFAGANALEGFQFPGKPAVTATVTVAAQKKETSEKPVNPEEG